MNIFPIPVSHDKVMRIALEMPCYQKARNDLWRGVQEIDFHGTIDESGMLSMSAWHRSDNGFILSAGTFWSGQKQLTPAQVKTWVEHHIKRLANEEIDRQDEEARQLRVAAEMDRIRQRMKGIP